MDPPIPYAPFSRLAVGVGLSPLGVNFLLATNYNKHFAFRTTGNFFQYTVSDISTKEFNVSGKLSLASAGSAVDFYPFARHGFRISPGMLFCNSNAANATFTALPGTGFTLNNTYYVSSSTDPVRGVGSLGLHSRNPAFTVTTGWGNYIPRKGGRWSFPFELGVAFTGAPDMNVALTSGQVCDLHGLNCVNVATDASAQANLQAEVAKYRSDLSPLRTFPIVSFGVAYTFRIRSMQRPR